MEKICTRQVEHKQAPYGMAPGVREVNAPSWHVTFIANVPWKPHTNRVNGEFRLCSHGFVKSLIGGGVVVYGQTSECD